MKITIAAIFAFCLCALSSFAQTYTIKGAVGDSVLKIKLHNSHISILNAKDSILRKYTRSAADGTFTITGLPSGKYLFLVTYPECADYVETITLEGANTTRNMGNINMELKTRLLGEALVKGAAIGLKLKGDTLVYDAKAYKIQPNDKVEDLIRQFPGIKVDKDGKITAQGEQVKKVLVDGEEFFGDDPLLVTKNLRADMVDKVELYDKKSDQATFTGVDDGIKTKTLNVKLKEDKKNGMFGKVDVGKGTDGYYEGQALFNKFKGKYKLSVYGTASNDGKNNLGYSDNDRLGTSTLTTVVLDDGNSYSVSGGNDALDQSSYNRVGFPSARTGGAHYDTKFNSDKSSINTNYRIGALSLNTTQNTLSQTNLPGNPQLNIPGSSQTTNRDQNSYAYTFRQKADIVYQNIPDANSNFKLGIDGSIKNTENKSNSLSSTRDSTGKLLNTTTIDNKNTGEQKTFNASLIYNKKLKKVGRTISFNASEAFNQTHSDGYLLSTIFTNKDSTTNQYKPTKFTSSVLNSNIVYTEPITKKLSLAFNYGLGINNNTSNRESYNKSASGKYDSLDVNFSNNYKFNQLTNQVGAIFNYKYTNGVFNFGTKASFVGYQQINQYTGNIFKRDFINWSPQLRFQHNFSTSTNFNFNYSGGNRQPTIDQLQPIRDNSNPLNIIVGNAGLSPSFSHSFNTRFTNNQRITSRYMYVSASYSFTENIIIGKTTIDAKTGKSVTEYVNLTNNKPSNYNIYADYQRKIWGGIDADIGVSAGGSTSYSYSNGVLNTSNRRDYSISMYLSKNVQKKYNIYVQAQSSYQFIKQTLLASGNYNTPGFSIYGGGTVYLPGKFQISSNIDYNYQGGVRGAPPVVYQMWSATMSKTFLKGDNLKLSIVGNNLLDQNQNQRYYSANGFTQNTYNSIQRYFMLNITWDFTKFGTSTN